MAGEINISSTLFSTSSSEFNWVVVGIICVMIFIILEIFIIVNDLADGYFSGFLLLNSFNISISWLLGMIFYLIIGTIIEYNIYILHILGILLAIVIIKFVLWKVYLKVNRR